VYKRGATFYKAKVKKKHHGRLQPRPGGLRIPKIGTTGSRRQKYSPPQLQSVKKRNSNRRENTQCVSVGGVRSQKPGVQVRGSWAKQKESKSVCQNTLLSSQQERAGHSKGGVDFLQKTWTRGD